MSISEIIFAVLSALLAIIGVVLTYRANKLSHEIAQRQGVFKEPNLNVEIYGQREIDHFILAIPLIPNGIIEFPLGFTISNHGGKSAKNFEVFVTMNKQLHYDGKVPFEMTSTLNKKVDVSFINENSHLLTVAYSVKELYPKQAFQISDILTINEATIEKAHIPARTRDEVDIIITLWHHLGYRIDFVILQNDHEPIAKRISFSIVDVAKKSLKEIFDEYNIDIAKERSKRPISFKIKEQIKNLFTLPKNISSKKIGVIFCNQDQIQTKIKHHKTSVYAIPKDTTLSMFEGIFFKSIGFWIPGLNIRFKNLKKAKHIGRE